MRYTHKQAPRDFKGTFNRAPWLLPGVGALLCILLLVPISDGTGIRFGIWMGIGNVFYFCYGFWRSAARKNRLSKNSSSTVNLLPIAARSVNNESGNSNLSGATEKEQVALPSKDDDNILSSTHQDSPVSANDLDQSSMLDEDEIPKWFFENEPADPVGHMKSIQ